MYFLLTLCAVLVYVDAADVDPCTLPLDMGTTPCKGKKPEIRYHFDQKAQFALAFEYTGCGGNKNNFENYHEVHSTCLGNRIDPCPAGSKPFEKPATCETDKNCGPKGTCRFAIGGFKVCCDKSIVDKFDADLRPKCPKGKEVYKIYEHGNPTIHSGKTCKSKFCPTGATCVEGNYMAACCK